MSAALRLAATRAFCKRRSTKLTPKSFQPLFTPPRMVEPLTFAESFFCTSSVPRSGTGDIKGNVIISEEEAVPVDNDPEKELERALALLEEAVALEKRSGAVSGLTAENNAKQLCDSYLRIKDVPEARRTFLLSLSKEGIHSKEAQVAAREYSEHPYEQFEAKLRRALAPTYNGIFNKIGHLVGGVKFLVDLRADLLDELRSGVEPSLKFMNIQLKQLLSHWFSVGLLELERVTWSSPCSMLQKVSDYESVHPMRNWTDLKSRVGPYRRVFTYTHGSMPGEPLVVLHVALTEEIPKSIGSVVKHHRLVKRFSVDTPASTPKKGGNEGEDPSLCTAAIFYSINSTQQGLQGIELGTHLIKEAVQELKEEVPSLAQFSTLSPIPGFRSWLLTQLHIEAREGEPDAHGPMFKEEEVADLGAALKVEGAASVMGALAKAVKANTWAEDPTLRSLLETPLMRLCARYLYVEKHRSKALDAVANFHLRNGAVLWRVNWMGDLSVRGMTQSCGIMVNYKYFLDALEENSTGYQEGNAVPAGEQVLELVKRAQWHQRK